MSSLSSHKNDTVMLCVCIFLVSFHKVGLFYIDKFCSSCSPLIGWMVFIISLYGLTDYATGYFSCAALQMSVQDNVKGSPSQSEMSKALEDQTFVTSILSSVIAFT